MNLLQNFKVFFLKYMISPLVSPSRFLRDVERVSFRYLFLLYLICSGSSFLFFDSFLVPSISDVRSHGVDAFTLIILLIPLMVMAWTAVFASSSMGFFKFYIKMLWGMIPIVFFLIVSFFISLVFAFVFVLFDVFDSGAYISYLLLMALTTHFIYISLIVSSMTENITKTRSFVLLLAKIIGIAIIVIVATRI